MCLCGKRQKKSLAKEKGKITGVVPRKLQILFFCGIIEKRQEKQESNENLISWMDFTVNKEKS